MILTAFRISILLLLIFTSHALDHHKQAPINPRTLGYIIDGATIVSDTKPIAPVSTYVEPLQTKKIVEAVYIATPTQTTQTSSSNNSQVANCGDNQYANYIYSHESGCKLVDPNGSGCDGIGQACPASKLAAVCHNWQTDYACQNQFFTNYANSKYGGWAGAAAFWQAHAWW